MQTAEVNTKGNTCSRTAAPTGHDDVIQHGGTFSFKHLFFEFLYHLNVTPSAQGIRSAYYNWIRLLSLGKQLPGKMLQQCLAAMLLVFLLGYLVNMCTQQTFHKEVSNQTRILFGSHFIVPQDEMRFHAHVSSRHSGCAAVVGLYPANGDHTITSLVHCISQEKFKLPDFVSRELHPCQIVSFDPKLCSFGQIRYVPLLDWCGQQTKFATLGRLTMELLCPCWRLIRHTQAVVHRFNPLRRDQRRFL
mmetsp:Transcript_10269/g.62923  ORF Transcript_10269/g.62923 Transcript_10269/m.62923 type:complete len:247 (+) Transcript_10269:1139-1879(+)